jgi:hypothetical protein
MSLGNARARAVSEPKRSRPARRAVDAIDHPDLCRLHLSVEKTIDRVGTAIKTVTQGTSG